MNVWDRSRKIDTRRLYSFGLRPEQFHSFSSSVTMIGESSANQIK